MSNPADLNAAFQIAKNVERGLEVLTNKLQPKEISNDTQRRQEPIVQASVGAKEIDELTSSFEKMKIMELERENRRLKNLANQRFRRPLQRNQLGPGRIPVCYRCNRTGHYANNCPEGRNIRTNHRVNMVDEYYDQDNKYYDECSYGKPEYDEIYYTEGYYDGYDAYEYTEPNYYVNELYGSQRTAKKKENRANPMTGYKNVKEPENLQEELREAGNRMNEDIPTLPATPIYDNIYENKGLRKWREAGGKPSGNRKPRENGSRLFDEISPYDIVQDVRDARANITFGQLVNENSKYHRQLREGTYKPKAMNNA
ncbi:unnamed protein product [Rhizophagus irregularis]|nr:unnamed protein product [Rhizophagus irregularis]